MQNAIEVANLKKSYGGFCLNDISFTVPDNCITGFIGANGAGKSTTIKSILRLIRADGGSVRFWGMEFEGHEREIKDRIGVVIDDGSFYDHLTMAQMKNIIAPAYSAWDEGAFKANMEIFSLNPRQKISTLSKGMRAKYALALALSHNADLLIMDEPTSGLDPVVRREFMNIILDFMKKDGKSVLFSTHIVSDLERVADMLLLIHEGSIVFEQEKDALLDEHRVVKGKRTEMTEECRKLFLSLSETDYGFEGITKNAAQIKRFCPSAVVERATLEDIMLAYVGGKRE